MKKLFIIAAAALFILLNAAPVGVWQSYSGARVTELFTATVMNPQWSHKKIEYQQFAGSDFKNYSAVVYLMGNDRPAVFKEWKKTHIADAEKFVRNGGTLVIIADGSPRAKRKTGLWKNLLGADTWDVFSGKADFFADNWKECGKNPAVHKLMLKDGFACLKDFTTGKMLIGNSSGGIVTLNKLGKGRVLFVNVKLTRSFTFYRQFNRQGSQAALEQYYPFARAIYSFIMEAAPDLQTEFRELWDFKPLGPKAVKEPPRKPQERPVVSPRHWQQLPGDKLTLVSGNTARAFIALKRGDRPAGRMLNDLLKKMSGVQLPMLPITAVVQDGSNWKWRKNEYQVRIEFVLQDKISIRAEKNKIVIGAPNQKIGIICFMREALGYRMLWPGKYGEVYKKSSEITLKPFYLTDAPFFRRRYIRNGLVHSFKNWKRADGTQVKLALEKSLLDKAKLTGFDPEEVAALRPDHRSWFVIQRLGGHFAWSGGNSFSNYFQRFGKTHPEYMALQFDGGRKMRTRHPRICKSNEAVIQQAVDDCRNFLNKHPKVKYFSLSPCDGHYDIFCMCRKCRSWDPSDGELITHRVFLKYNRPTFRYPRFSDRVLRFTAAVAKELKKSHPDVKIFYLAYADYQYPPEYFRDFPDNMAITFVGFQYLNRDGLEKDRKSWDFWAANFKELNLRPNYLLGGAGYPVVYVTEMAKDIKHCAATGMITSDFDSLTHNWAVNGLNYYVLAQLLWDPSQSADEIIDDYCRSGFGSAAKVMKEYFLYCEKLTAQLAEARSEDISEVEDLTAAPKNFADLFSNSFNDAAMKKLKSLLNEARRLTADDEEARQRVEFIETGLIFTCRRIEFIRQFKKLRSAGDRNGLRKIAAAQQKEWKNLFRNYPYAINIPALAIDQYYRYWRYCR